MKSKTITRVFIVLAIPGILAACSNQPKEIDPRITPNRDIIEPVGTTDGAYHRHDQRRAAPHRFEPAYRTDPYINARRHIVYPGEPDCAQEVRNIEDIKWCTEVGNRIPGTNHRESTHERRSDVELSPHSAQSLAPNIVRVTCRRENVGSSVNWVFGNSHDGLTVCPNPDVRKPAEGDGSGVVCTYEGYAAPYRVQGRVVDFVGDCTDGLKHLLRIRFTR